MNILWLLSTREIAELLGRTRFLRDAYTGPHEDKRTRETDEMLAAELLRRSGMTYEKFVRTESTPCTFNSTSDKASPCSSSPQA